MFAAFSFSSIQVRVAAIRAAAGGVSEDRSVSTRYLIIIALITGLVILAASAVQFLMAR